MLLVVAVVARRKTNRNQTGIDVENRPPEWAGRELVYCTSGPLSGQWFFREDWDARCRGQQRMRDLGQHRSRGALEYQLTVKEVENPAFPGVMGTLAVHPEPEGVA